uniref:sugar phosphate nucleotidyltransferase n=1 Tax=Cellvibrio fontiphilus TaxID=1815559 RepID=UPI002B4C0FEB|nr:sugar phosphate nucleotidyltransferase [Cellvibrio fontiphilus]
MYEAIILAGGFGTRLRETVPDLPKPMAPIAGKPFLAWQLDYLIACGVSRFILSVGYKANTIRDYFGDTYGDATIVYVEEVEPLGTGGALQLALDQASQSRVFAFNGDTLCEANLQHLRTLVDHRPDAVGILVKHIDNTARYGAIEFDASGFVTAFGEKSKQGAGFINAGIYDVPRDLFNNLRLSPPFSFEAAVLNQLSGKNLFATLAGEFFIDIGIKDDFLLAQTLVPFFVDTSNKAN